MCRSRAAGQRLVTLMDYLRLLGESLEPPGAGEAPILASYRVHVRMEKSGRNGTPTPTLSYWHAPSCVIASEFAQHKGACARL